MRLRKPYSDELVETLPLKGSTVGIVRSWDHWAGCDSYSVRFVSDCSSEADELLDKILDGMLRSRYEDEYLDELWEKLKEAK